MIWSQECAKLPLMRLSMGTRTVGVGAGGAAAAVGEGPPGRARARGAKTPTMERMVVSCILSVLMSGSSGGSWLLSAVEI